MALWPLASSTPITWHESFPRRIWLPRGSSPPNNFWRTVSPTTQTPAPARTSLSLNRRPFLRGLLVTVKYWLSVPVTVVDQF